MSLYLKFSTKQKIYKDASLSLSDMFEWFRKKQKKKSEYNGFSDMDRELSARKRQLNAEMKYERQLKEIELLDEKINEIRERRLGDMYESDEPEEDSPEKVLLMSILAPVLQNMMVPGAGSNSETTPSQQEPAPGMNNLTDEQILELIKKIPKSFLRLGKKLSNDELQTTIKMKFPGIDTNTLTRAVSIFRENF